MLFKCAPGVAYKGLFAGSYLQLRVTMLRRVRASEQHGATGPYYYQSCTLQGGLRVNFESKGRENVVSLRWATPCVYPETPAEIRVVETMGAS